MRERPAQTSVLVVDDDAGIRAMLQLAFAARGYRVDAIGDRREGWARPPDVVVLDALLDGETAEDFLLQTGLDQAGPVILMTAAEDVETMATNGRYAGIVRKPFDLDDLFDAVDRAVATRTTS